MRRRRLHYGGWSCRADLSDGGASAARQCTCLGFIGPASASAWHEFVSAFERRLSELGRTINIEHRWTDGRNEQVRAFADAFVQRSANVIVVGGDGVAAAKQATTSNLATTKALGVTVPPSLLTLADRAIE